jgi:cellobiose phosphorylase
MIGLCQVLGKNKLNKRYQGDYKVMRKIVNQVGWDGAWYVRYFDQRGEPVGSQRNPQGQIYTNAQSWAVLSGFASSKRALTALDAVTSISTPATASSSAPPATTGMTPKKAVSPRIRPAPRRTGHLPARQPLGDDG